MNRYAALASLFVAAALHAGRPRRPAPVDKNSHS